MECQPQSSPPEPCPLYWSCQISRGHSIKSEFQISKKCMGSLNDYLLLTHTHACTHTHIHSRVHVCAHANTAPVISEAGLPNPRDTYRRAQRAGACSPRAVGLGLSRHAQTQPLPPASCGKVLLSEIRGGTQGWAVGQADSPAFRTPLFALDLGMKQPRGWNV